MKKLKFYLIISIVMILTGQKNLFAQVANTGILDTTGGTTINKLKIGGYIDSYFGYNFSKPKDGNNPYFVSMNRNNEVNINLAYIDLVYTDERIRARFVPGFGTYMNANYAAESGALKYIIEGSIGIKVFANKNIWIDAGVLGSPYTNESAISRDHLMYTRSFAPEYVPYYLSGIKASIPLSKKVNAYLYLLNGWQQIQDQNNGKSIGTQIEYRPNDKNLFNWNTYIGDERSSFAPDNRMRYFTDVFWIYNPDGKFSITSCAYIGVQEQIDSDKKKDNKIWWQANIIGRVKFSPKSSVSARIEYFSDPNNIQITPITTLGGFQSYSTGLCYNLKITQNLLFRLEGRQFFSDRKMYVNASNEATNQSAWLISNLTVWF
jgi:hypothetical protein